VWLLHAGDSFSRSTPLPFLFSFFSSSYATRTRLSWSLCFSGEFVSPVRARDASVRGLGFCLRFYFFLCVVVVVAVCVHRRGGGEVNELRREGLRLLSNGDGDG
jgi:hypothetical protein